ncbi:MAG: hypothetical protein HY748_14615 [Elusimicrobia bacterium]|nr:hypothetical protein [Elusimicrobiota bacterium]
MAAVALAGLASSAWAASVADKMTYQGRLKESGSLVTGVKSVDIWLCNTQSGGTGCGSSPGITGNDSLGRITIGSVPSGTTCALNFTVSWAPAWPVCFVNSNLSDYYSDTPNQGQVNFIRNANTNAGDQFDYFCIGR